MPDGDTITPNGDDAQVFCPQVGKVEIGRRVKALREKNLRMERQADLSRALTAKGVRGASTSQISRVEDGDRYPTLEFIVWLAHLAGVSTDAILVGDQDAAEQRRTADAAAFRRVAAVVLDVLDLDPTKPGALEESLKRHAQLWDEAEERRRAGRQ